MLRQIHSADDLPSPVLILPKSEEASDEPRSARSSYNRCCRDFARPSLERHVEASEMGCMSWPLTRALGRPKATRFLPQLVFAEPAVADETQHGDQEQGLEDSKTPTDQQEPEVQPAQQHEDSNVGDLWASARSTFAPRQPRVEYPMFESEASGPSRYEHLTMRRRGRHTVHHVEPLFPRELEDELCAIGSSTPRANRSHRTAGGMGVSAAARRRRVRTYAAGAALEAADTLPRLLTCDLSDDDKATCET